MVDTQQVEKPDPDKTKEALRQVGKNPIDPSTGKPKRGRPKGTRNKPREDDTPKVTPEMLRAQKIAFEKFVSLPFEFAAKRYGVKWKLDIREASQLADATILCAEKYLPDMMEYYPLAYLGGTLLMIISSRLSLEDNPKPEIPDGSTAQIGEVRRKVTPKPKVQRG